MGAKQIVFTIVAGAGLSLLLWTAVVAAEAPKMASIPMFVEQDPWTSKCEDDAKIPGPGGFGAGYSGLARPFTTGHKYRVTGSMGWSFLLTVDDLQKWSVAEVQPGPHLTNPPVVRVGQGDSTSGANPVEVIFGPVKEFVFDIPLDYLSWEIPGVYAMRPGRRLIELPDGKWEVRGVIGWSVPISIAEGVVRMADAPAGLSQDLVKPSMIGFRLDPMPEPNFVRIVVPSLLGQYRILSTLNVELLPPAEGPQSMMLPPDDYKIAGTGWESPLIVGQGSATIPNLPDATPAGMVSVLDGRTGAEQMMIRPKGKFSVATPWGVQPLDISGPPELTDSYGVGWSKDTGHGLLVSIKQTPAEWRVAATFVRGGGKDWAITARMLPLDQASVAKPPDLGTLSEEKAIAKPQSMMAGVYAVEVRAVPPDAPADSPSICTARAVVAVDGEPAASLWFGANRVAYQVHETIEVSVWQDVKRNRAARLFLVSAAGVPPFDLGKVGAPFWTMRLRPNTLSPGMYQVELREGDTVTARRSLEILPDQSPTQFPIHAYESILNRPGDVEKLNLLGITAFLD